MASRLNLSRSRILVVDDSPQSLEIISQILLGIGATNNKRVTSSAEAQTFVHIEPYDLILLDGEMPGLDGFGLTHEIRRAPRGANAATPIIILSAFTPKAKVERARDSGANMVISKPIVPAILLERIERIARENRQFVSCETYCGPDRRFKSGPPPEGIEERRADAKRLLAAPERALSQDEINSLFD